jgi:SAM-dependent methyltransferase
MNELTPVGYNLGWETKWDDMKKYGPISRHIRRMMKKLISSLEFETVLDVGCGQGSLLAELFSKFPHIKAYGVDISPVAVGLAGKRVPQGEFRVLDITNCRLAKKFDLVICSEVLEHIPDDLRALANLAQMTEKYLVVSTVQGRMRRFETMVGHVRNYAPGELTQKMEASGFQILQIVEWGFPFYSPIYRNLLEIIRGRGTTGTFGVSRRLISTVLFYWFMLNSSRRGDEILILAEHLSSRE